MRMWFNSKYIIGLRGSILLYVSLLSILLQCPETDTSTTFIRRERSKKCIFSLFLKETRQKLLSYRIFFITLHYKYKYVLTGII